MSREFGLGSHLNARDEKAVRKTVSGFLKLLHPDERWTRAELREYVVLALESLRRVKEQLKKLAPHEYGRTSFSYIELDSGRESFVDTPEQPESLDLSAPQELDPIEEEVRAQPSDLPILELVELPESQTLEFKASMRYDYGNGGANKALEQVIVKSIAGLMNARGGVLLIGVSDSGDVVGIQRDLEVLPNRHDRDGYENHLTTLLEQSLGAAATASVHVRFDDFDAISVCRVTVAASGKPVWTKVKGQEDVFYLRLNNSTRPLGPREAFEYISQHFA